MTISIARIVELAEKASAAPQVHLSNNDINFIKACSPKTILAFCKAVEAAINLKDNSPIDDKDRPYISEVSHIEFNRLMESLSPFGRE